jgi:hypothetical protein
VLDEHNAVGQKQAIPLVILGRACRGMCEVPIHFENAPLAFGADEKIGFTVLPFSES